MAACICTRATAIEAAMLAVQLDAMYLGGATE